MTPLEFIAKWRNVELKERSASQTHFNDLCVLLGLPDPVAADPTGEWFTFEKGASKTAGGEGWADVWRSGAFAWEYKGKRKNLDEALKQLLLYAAALENPPLLIVSDMDRIRVHTNWTNTVAQVHEIKLDDLLDGAKRDLLRHAFTDPERLRPTKTRQALTEEAAESFAVLAQRLRARGHDAQAVAHFVNRLVFCLFAEDVELLPNKMFQRMVEGCQAQPDAFEEDARSLFGAMRIGGKVGFERVAWFNGGLFDDDVALPLERADLVDLLVAAKLNWSAIDPSILGTLFERGLDPDKRSQLGAHYTGREMIERIVGPVVVDPLLAEWAGTRDRIADALAREKAGKATVTRNKAHAEAVAAKVVFLERLRAFRVLDPACGSGNFLYLALRALKDVEHRANIEAEVLGLPRDLIPLVGPENVLGIELNPYAAELARVSVWIGDIQWMRSNGYDVSRDPILRPLANIECRDALLNGDGTPADWPNTDVVIGNPPFLGSKLLRKGRPARGKRPTTKGLGDKYVNALFHAYKDNPRKSSDLVTYWFSKSADLLRADTIQKFGLVATKSIAKGSSNIPLAQIVEDDQTSISHAWHNIPWVIDGAEVRVSLICASRGKALAHLDGNQVPAIGADLTIKQPGKKPTRLRQNHRVGFQGVKMNGSFSIASDLARTLLSSPTNINGQSNFDVVRRFYQNDDVTERDTDSWIVDFWPVPDYADAINYEEPFKLVTSIADSRTKLEVGEATETEKLSKFWLMQRPRPRLREAIKSLQRVIATPETSEHRLFRFLPAIGTFSGSLFVFARQDDFFFGMLQSRIHEVWSGHQGNRLGAGNQRRYNVTFTFETFPFPAGLSPDIPVSAIAADPRVQAIASAAAALNEKREAWLNPPDLAERVAEVVPGFPERLIPTSEAAAKMLKKRNLTALYKDRPAWLTAAHSALDVAVADSYGWKADWLSGVLTDEVIVARLFVLNQERSKTAA